MVKKKKNSTRNSNLIPQERIESKIVLIRGLKVMLDSDLAELYDVPTKRLKEQVRRNIRRFPDDFMMELNLNEIEALASRSQFATLKKGQNIKYPPFAFTEQGVSMLSSVLNSDRAIDVNILIMRSFAKLRELMLSHKDLSYKIADLERKSKKHDQSIKAIFQAIRKLLEEPVRPKNPIGFHVK
ncbi:hypothetical protein MNBD_BACTEROID05-1079 [hydrothermal vent metagenome]|uniref:KilA-N DNA-binding domain-containing protein n=1 Tax=hydrothermal vent metagenome TaxID=652676 RepID=A0A3B0TT24_9ZZZZ